MGPTLRSIPLSITLLLPLLLSPAGVRGQEARPEVVARFAGVAVRGDYVLAVDASKTMASVVDRVRGAVASLVPQLPEGDHLSILRFANRADEYLPDRTIRRSEQEALVQEIRGLAEPTGTRTDLGAGIARALQELARPGFGDVQFLFFVSDFCHDPPDDSPWFGQRSWRTGRNLCRELKGVQALAEQARMALAGHRIRVIVLRLPGFDEEGMRAFRTIFPGAFEVDLERVRLEEYFDRFQKELAFEKVAVLAREEVSKASLGVSMEPSVLTVEPGRDASAVLRLQNAMPHLDMRVRWGGGTEVTEGEVEVRVDSKDVVIPPGASVEVPFAVRVAPCKDRPCGGSETFRRVTWKPVLHLLAEPALGLRQVQVAPELPDTEPSLALEVRWTCATAGWVCAARMAGVAGVVLALVLIGVAFVLRRRPARFGGTLQVQSGPSAGQAVSLGGIDRDMVTVGRGADNTLVLGDPRVAARHATIHAERQGIFGQRVVFTLVAHDEVRIGGRSYRNRRVFVSPGTIIEIGETRLRWTR